MKSKPATLKLDFKTLLTFSLVAIALAPPLLFLIFERISSSLFLRAERSRLAAAGLTRTYREIVPPPDAEAVKNGDKLIAAITDLKKIDRNYQDIVLGPEFMRQTGPAEATPAFGEAVPIINASKPKTPPLSWEALEEQTNHAEAILANSLDILKSPVALRINYDSLHSALELGQSQKLGALFRTRFALDLHAHKIDAAISDLEAIHAIADFQGTSGTLVSATLKLGMLIFGLIGPTWDLLSYPDLTDAELQRIQQLFARDNLIAIMAVAIETEHSNSSRYYAEVLNAKSSSGATVFGTSPSGLLGTKWMQKLREELWPIVWADGDQARQSRYWRRSIAHARELKKSKNWQVVKMAMLADYVPPSHYDSWRFPLYAMYESDVASSVLKSAVRGQIQIELTKAAIGLARFKLANSRYPERLDELVPQFLSETPHDWENGQPLKYRRLEDGTYLLYSVGPDGIDGGGNPSPWPGRESRLLDGRDIVWPRAARQNP